MRCSEVKIVDRLDGGGLEYRLSSLGLTPADESWYFVAQSLDGLVDVVFGWIQNGSPCDHLDHAGWKHCPEGAIA